MDARHDDVEDLLAVYALDAVDDDERAAVEAHLLGCPRCRAEVDAHREVASHLAQSGAPAPEGLWDRIAGAIAGEPPPPMRLVVEDGPAPSAGRQIAAARPRRGRVPLAAAAAAVVAVALVSLGVALGSGDDPAEPGLAEVALAAFDAPEAQTSDLVDADGEPLARVAVLPDGTGYLQSVALPELDGRIYQLWGTDGDSVVSLGAMGSAPAIVAFHADGAQTTFMITEEDEPVAQTSNVPVAVGELT
jgi:hypothetical protein